MRISDLNSGHCYIGAICSDVTGTEDVNVLVEYSFDRTNALATALNSGAIDDMDALGTTMKIDTVDVIGGANCGYYKAALWMRLKFDEQTNNPATVISWWLTFKKNEPFKYDDDGAAFRYKVKY